MLVLLQNGLASGQSLYMKAGGQYNVPVSKDPLPEYFSFNISGYLINVNVNFDNPDFSVAEGANAMWTFGYSFNDFLSLELGASYFSNTKKEFIASPANKNGANGKTNWDYKNYNLLPAIVFSRAFNKSALDFKLYTGIGLSDLDVKATYDNLYYKNYTFNKSISYSYGYGMEYLYNLSPTIQLYANAGINNTFYSPKHAKMVASSGNFKSTSVFYNEIDYVKDISNISGYYYNSHFITDTDKPEIRTRETLKANSFYFGIGIKYTLIKNEKN